MTDMWQEFENRLNETDRKICLWWRDDDIRAKKFKLFKLSSDLKYKRKIKALVRLFNQYQIPAVFAIIPNNYVLYGQWFTKFLKKNHMRVILHGLLHQNFAKEGLPKSEFPDENTAERDCAEIMSYYKQFQPLFGELLLPFFCPPYNNINARLEEAVEACGLGISKANFNQSLPQECHVDYDFCDWSICKVKNHAVILTELADLIASGKNVIGINGHHACLHFTRGDFDFFDKLFSVLARHQNIHWICPLEINKTNKKLSNS